MASLQDVVDPDYDPFDAEKYVNPLMQVPSADAIRNWATNWERPAHQGKVLFTTASPYANITDQDIDRGISVAMSAGTGTIKPKFNSLDELRNHWTDQGVRNYVGQHQTTGNLQLSDLVVPKEMRNSGVGSQFMNDLTDLADTQGRTVTLTPDKSYGATSVGRLKDFYKRFGFVENKGKNADYTISDSMYREPKKDVGTSGQVPTSGSGEGEGGPSIKAYHGSPYDFDAFDMSKIGTGEGAQAYGHGLYFAENEGTAKSYQDALSHDSFAVNGEPRTMPGLSPELRQAVKVIDEYGGADAAKAHFSQLPGSEVPRWIDKAREMGLAPYKGKMYEVNINADPAHFLDWDKPLSEQHPKVQEVLGSGNDTAAAVLGRAYRNDMHAGDLIGKDRASPTELTQGLADRGIPGIKYLDQGSRFQPDQVAHLNDQIRQLEAMPQNEDVARALTGRRAELAAMKPTNNYVVFDHNIVNIVKKYGLAGLSMLPPAIGAELSNQVKEVDHDPFAGAAKSQATGKWHKIAPVDHNPFEGT